MGHFAPNNNTSLTRTAWYRESDLPLGLLFIFIDCSPIRCRNYLFLHRCRPDTILGSVPSKKSPKFHRYTCNDSHRFEEPTKLCTDPYIYIYIHIFDCNPNSKCYVYNIFTISFRWQIVTDFNMPSKFYRKNITTQYFFSQKYWLPLWQKRKKRRKKEEAPYIISHERW